MLAKFESIMTSKNNATMKKRTETIFKKKQEPKNEWKKQSVD